MKEYVVSKLIKEFEIPYEEAVLFYNKVYDKKRISELIVKLDYFVDYEQIKKYFLGGK